MVSTSSLKLQQSPASGSPAAYWNLVPARACTLRPQEAGVLRVAHGQVWATLDGPHAGPANDWGDVVLRSGQQITLLPGQQLVVEPLGDAVNEPAFISWEPRPMAPAAASVDDVPWSDPLARPCQEPGALWPQLLPAAASLLGRLAAAAHMLVAGRGRVLSPLEGNQP